MSSAVPQRRQAIDDHLELHTTAADEALSVPGVAAPTTPRPLSPHPLEAHLQQLETYETERPPFYNKSTLAPDLIFSADSLRQDARILAKVLVSFLAYAIKTHGTTGSCIIGLWGRFEMWPERPTEANNMTTSMLNEKNLVYSKAIKYTRKDLQDRGLWIKKLSVRDDKKRSNTVAEWAVDWHPPASGSTYQPPSANELIRLHQQSHSERYSAHNANRPMQRAQSGPSMTVHGLNRMMGRANNDRPSLPRKRSRKRSDTNEFGYYGSNCVLM